MGYIYVKNKKGTANNTPPSGYSSWLDFWEKKKGRKAKICKARGCIGNPDVGGHVIKAGQGGKEYILPICYEHNNKSEDETYQALESDLVPVV